jgi:hypothetical protein
MESIDLVHTSLKFFHGGRIAKNAFLKLVENKFIKDNFQTEFNSLISNIPI